DGTLRNRRAISGVHRDEDILGIDSLAKQSFRIGGEGEPHQAALSGSEADRLGVQPARALTGARRYVVASALIDQGVGDPLRIPRLGQPLLLPAAGAPHTADARACA